MREKHPHRENEARVYIDTDMVKGWYAWKRSPLDRSGKKHLIVFKDDEGNPISSAWLTSEEQTKMALEKKFRK